MKPIQVLSAVTGIVLFIGMAMPWIKEPFFCNGFTLERVTRDADTIMILLLATGLGATVLQFLPHKIGNYVTLLTGSLAAVLLVKFLVLHSDLRQYPWRYTNAILFTLGSSISSVIFNLLTILNIPKIASNTMKLGTVVVVMLLIGGPLTAQVEGITAEDCEQRYCLTNETSGHVLLCISNYSSHEYTMGGYLQPDLIYRTTTLLSGETECIEELEIGRYHVWALKGNVDGPILYEKEVRIKECREVNYTLTD